MYPSFCICGVMVSLPSRERGLKYLVGLNQARATKSLPSRERGLKLTGNPKTSGSAMSLPSRERGLKFWAVLPVDSWLPVAPFTGAWIEIQP